MKKIITLSLVVAMVIVATSAFADDVFVTKHGKRFHKADCKVVKGKEVQKIDQAQAEQKGLKACNVCFKDSAQTQTLKGEHLSSLVNQ